MSLNLHPIACVTCKIRKVRCDRVLPRCSRCVSQDAACDYRQRKKKQAGKASEARVAELDALFTRLQRVESTIQTRGFPYQQDSPLSSSNGAAQTISEFSTPGSLPTTRYEDDTIPELLKDCNVIQSEAEDENIHAMLEGAIQRILKRRLDKTYHALTASKAIEIDPELARSWVISYFAESPGNMIAAVKENEKLFMILPDLLNQEHVHVDPAIILMYYGVLFNACCLPSSANLPSQSASEHTDRLYQLLLRTLPAWQRTSTGSTTDLSAAFMVTLVAIDYQDFALGHRMHVLACQYAESLKLHMLDSNHGGPGSEIPRTNAERRRFWDIVQYDAYFRLMLDVPSAMKTPMREWRVDLPYLGTGVDIAENAEMGILFLFCSRITFEFATFFELIDALPNSGDGTQSRQDLLPQVEHICQRIQNQYEEWQIDNVLAHTNVAHLNGWLVADTAISGIMCQMLILRAVGVTNSSYILSISRHVLHVVEKVLTQMCTPFVMSACFFALRAYVAFACLAEHLSQQTADAQDSEQTEDKALLGRLEALILGLCETHTELTLWKCAIQRACWIARHNTS